MVCFMRIRHRKQIISTYADCALGAISVTVNDCLPLFVDTTTAAGIITFFTFLLIAFLHFTVFFFAFVTTANSHTDTGANDDTDTAADTDTTADSRHFTNTKTDYGNNQKGNKLENKRYGF